jgi:hypothetical protein
LFGFWGGEVKKIDGSKHLVEEGVGEYVAGGVSPDRGRQSESVGVGSSNLSKIGPSDSLDKGKVRVNIRSPRV